MKKMDKKVYVTQPQLPDINEYMSILSQAWDTKYLTNNGALHNEFEKRLSDYLGLEYVSLLNNATIALLIAQKAIGFKNEIITTPYSFIATSHSIIWNGLEPVFVDTDLGNGNLLPDRIEAAITKKTGGILAVHNFGVPGDLEELDQIAKKYNLPLIYDAAPCMGVKYKGASILKYGDLSVLSFHATKVFTTFEGGAIISRSAEMKYKIDNLKNFGIEGLEDISAIGINGKMNEAEAAMGILQLRYFDKNILRRKKIYKKYKEYFESIGGIRLMDIPKNVEYNYGYCPIFFSDGKKTRDKVYNALLNENIACRKYWYPLVTNHSIYNQYKKLDINNAQKLSDSVLCLPIYPDLKYEVLEKIFKIISFL